MKKDTFNLRFKGVKDKLYAHASKNDKSINETINRCISGALANEKIFFEMQHLNIGEKFSFKEDFEADPSKCEMYRYLNIDPKNGDYMCSVITSKGEYKRFKYKDVFYKQIFTH